jgi:hypothetical protein
MRLVTLVVFLAFAALANAQVLTLGEVKDKKAVQLNTADLKQLMPNAKVVSRTIAGSNRTWNNGSGTFIASSDGRGSNNVPRTGQGTWRIDDKQGTYCVTIKWPRVHEDWCRYIFKVGDKFYGFDDIDNDNEQSAALEFSK